MPNRWPIASGNWSNAAIWSGSIIPTASDDVFANNRTVTIDTNIQVLSLRTTATASAVSGGLFVSTNNIDIKATGIGILAGGSDCLRITGSNFVTITGSSTGGSLLNCRGINISENGTLFISGTISAGAGVSAQQNHYGILNTAGNLTVTGNLFGSVSNASAAVAASGGTTNIQGNLYRRPFAVFTLLSGNGNANIYGDMVILNNAGTTTPHVIIHAGSGTLNFTGSVIGDGNGYGISITSTGLVYVSGSVTSLTNVGILTTTNCTLNVIGPIYSGPADPGIQSTSTSATVRVSGPLINQNNINAVFSPKIQLLSNSTPYYKIQSDTFGREVTFYDASYTSSLPAQTNVRSGSLYGGSNQFSGSMIIPSTASVRYGVPVDNVTGSATIVTPQDIFDYAITSLTGSNTIGERLKNISTVQTTAATIAAFKGK
jgi:hypothetical protein